jgi:hypothetical protein
MSELPENTKGSSLASRCLPVSTLEQLLVNLSHGAMAQVLVYPRVFTWG